MVKSKMELLNSKEGVNSVISNNQNLEHINSEIFDQISLLKKEKYTKMYEVLEKVILSGNKTHYFREVNELIK